MKRHTAIFSILYAPGAFAQVAPDAVDAHLAAARIAAGFDFTGTLARLCVAPTPVPYTLRDVAPGPGIVGRRTGQSFR